MLQNVLLCQKKKISKKLTVAQEQERKTLAQERSRNLKEKSRHSGANQTKRKEAAESTSGSGESDSTDSDEPAAKRAKADKDKKAQEKEAKKAAKAATKAAAKELKKREEKKEAKKKKKQEKKAEKGEQAKSATVKARMRKGAAAMEGDEPSHRSSLSHLHPCTSPCFMFCCTPVTTGNFDSLFIRRWRRLTSKRSLSRLQMGSVHLVLMCPVPHCTCRFLTAWVTSKASSACSPRFSASPRTRTNMSLMFARLRQRPAVSCW